LLQTVVNSDGPLLTNGSTGINVRSDDTLQAQAGTAFSVMQKQPLNLWTHVVVTRNTTTTSFYLNGELTDVVPNDNTSSVSATSNEFKIGCTRNLDRFFNGKIYDVGICDRALTHCEVADLYHAQLGYLNTTNTITETALDSYELNGQTYTTSGTYTQVIENTAGCDSTISLNLTVEYTSLNELQMSSKKLLRITDLNGRQVPFRKNELLLFIYEDGTIERVFSEE
jgi:hypothetical protein